MNTRLSNNQPSRSSCRGRRGFLCGLLLIASALLPSIAKGEEIFADLAKQKQVESTYISGRFGHNMRTWRSMSGQRAMNLGTEFSALYTYQCYSEASVKMARKLLDNYVAKTKNVELMMRSTEHGSEYIVYEQFNKEDKLLRMVIWNSDSPAVCEIVVVEWKDGIVRNTSSIESYDITPFWKGALSFQLDNFGYLNGLEEYLKIEDYE